VSGGRTGVCRTGRTHAVEYVKRSISSYVCGVGGKTVSLSPSFAWIRVRAHRSPAVRDDGPDVREQRLLLVGVQRQEREDVHERVRPGLPHGGESARPCHRKTREKRRTRLVPSEHEHEDVACGAFGCHSGGGGGDPSRVAD
jgi:hypothetical protein